MKLCVLITRLDQNRYLQQSSSKINCALIIRLVQNTTVENSSEISQIQLFVLSISWAQNNYFQQNGSKINCMLIIRLVQNTTVENSSEISQCNFLYSSSGWLEIDIFSRVALNQFQDGSNSIMCNIPLQQSGRGGGRMVNFTLPNILSYVIARDQSRRKLLFSAVKKNQSVTTIIPIC